MKRWLAVLFSTVVASTTLALMTVPAQGRLVYRNPYTQPVSETEETCSGDVVELSGLLRHSVVIVEDATGGIHSSYTIRWHLTGVTEGGTRYVGAVVNNGAEYFSADEMPANGTFGDRFRLISQDGSPNLLVHAQFHITVNAAGEVTTFWNELDVVCR